MLSRISSWTKVNPQGNIIFSFPSIPLFQCPFSKQKKRNCDATFWRQFRMKPIKIFMDCLRISIPGVY